MGDDRMDGPAAGSIGDGLPLEASDTDGLLLVVVAEFADPDVAILDGVVVPLQHEGGFGGMVLGVAGSFLMHGGSLQVLGCLHDDAVEEDRDLRGGDHFAVFGDGGFEDDVVALPFALRGSGIDEGWELSVDGTGLAIGVGLVGVAFHHLDFVFAHEKDAGVAAALSVDFAVGGDAVFDVKLTVAEFFFRSERLGGGDEDAVFDLPLSFPSVGVGAVEEDLGIGGGLYGEAASALDFARLGAGGVVHGVFRPGDEGGVGVKLFGGFLLVVVGEEQSGWEQREESEFGFHSVFKKTGV